MSDILFEVLKCVIIISIMLITRYAIPYLNARVQESKYAEIVEWAKSAVLMAEQTITKEKSGAEKKRIVVDFLKRILISKNISITDEQLDTLIESAVYAMKKE